MKRPKKEDYIRNSHQMDYQLDLAKYYRDLEVYCDYLEKKLNVVIPRV
jgi:hypothetical protein